jgi:hypothetical protein
MGGAGLSVIGAVMTPRRPFVLALLLVILLLIVAVAMIPRRPPVLALAACSALLSGALEAGEVNDPLLALPTLPKPVATAVAPPGEMTEFAPGVLVTLGQRVALTGKIIIDQGPVDGMEVLACLQAGKTHEANILLTAASGQVVKTAFIAALGFSDGVAAPENGGLPARGTPVRVVVQWQSLDQPGQWLAVDASCLIRDRVPDRPYPPLPYVYTGSRFQVLDETGTDSKPVKREHFMLDSTRSVVVNYDEPDALLASPFPGSGANDHRYEANSGISPPVGAAVRLVFEKAELPLTLALPPDGKLRQAGADGAPLDDAALGELLAKSYGAGAKPNLRAVGVTVAAGTDRQLDVAARQRLLAAAAAAKAWVVPVFILGN